MITQAQLLTALQAHIGAASGITAEALARQLGCTTRQVRAMVKLLRLDSVAVCGHPRDGYFIAATPEELEDTCQFLRARSLTSLLQESTLRKMPMTDLIGQLKLPT